MEQDDPAGAIESFRAALREALKDNPTGDFGAEAAVEAFDECLSLTRQEVLASIESSVEAILEPALKSWLDDHHRGFVTIAQEDVGRSLFEAFGRKWPTTSFIGRITSLDVGKRVYLRGGVLQVENNEQRDARKVREGVESPRSGDLPFGD